MVVPDFFYGDPVVNPSDPKFDRDSWLKAHDTVSFLPFSCNLEDVHLNNCARIKKTSRAHINLPLMS